MEQGRLNVVGVVRFWDVRRQAYRAATSPTGGDTNDPGKPRSTSGDEDEIPRSSLGNWVRRFEYGPGPRTISYEGRNALK